MPADTPTDERGWFELGSYLVQSHRQAPFVLAHGRDILDQTFTASR